MGVYIDQLFNETTARTAETQMLSGTGTTAGKYYPLFKGKLVKVTIYNTPQAATSLCQAAHVKLIQQDWDPNTIIFPVGGYGLQTVAGHGGDGEERSDYVVDLVVAPDKPIDSLLIEFDSPVTPRIRVVGTFTM